MVAAAFVPLVVFSLLLICASGYRNITVRHFNKIHIQASETSRFRLADYFSGQMLSYSATNPKLMLNKPWREDPTCRGIESKLGDTEGLVQLVAYEDVQQPLSDRVLYAATNMSHFYRASTRCNDSSMCAVINCEYNSGGEFFAWGQVGEKFLHILFYKNRLEVHVQSAADPACHASSSYQISSPVPDLATALDESRLIVVNDKQLSIIEFAPSERTLYVNMRPFSHHIQQVLVNFPLVITLESVSNEVRILRYDPSYEDLFDVSTFFIQIGDSIHQLFLTQYEPDTLIAVAQNSDKILLYDISNAYAPRLVKTYFDPDFAIPTSLPPSVSRVAATCDYIAVLVGDPVDELKLRVIRKGREQRNYLVDDIGLGKGHASPSLTMLNYYGNRFMIALEQKTRVFTFTDDMLTLVGGDLSNDENNVTEVAGQIVAAGRYWQKSSDVRVVVYPFKLQFITIPKEKSQSVIWVAFQGHQIIVDLTKYYMGSAVSVASIQADNATYIEKQDRLQFHDTIELSWSNKYYSCLWTNAGNVMIAHVEKQPKRIAVRYCEITMYGVNDTKSIASIDYEREFDVMSQTFSEDLKKVFIHVKFQLSDGPAYLLYYTGYDAKTIYFVTEMDMTGSECNPVKLHYQESANYIFSAARCYQPGWQYGTVTRFRLSPTSPTTVLSTSKFKIDGRYLIDFYAGSDVYAVYITSFSYDTRFAAALTFTEPYFQNEHSIANYHFGMWNFIGAQYAPRRLVVFLEDKMIFSNIIKEFSILTASNPVFRRDLNLPQGHTFVVSQDNNNTVVSDIDGDYLGVVTRDQESYCFVIYNLNEVGMNSLYELNCSLGLPISDPPTILDLLSINDAIMYVLVYTKSQIYKYTMSKTYDTTVRAPYKDPKKDTYANRFNVTVRSQVHEAPFTFTVTTQQLPAPPVLNLTRSKVATSQSALAISSFFSGYDLFVSLKEQIPDVYVTNREFVSTHHGVKRDITVLAYDVDAVLPLDGGDLVLTRNSNNVNMFEANRGETQLQVVPELSEIRMTYMLTEGTCAKFAIYNTAYVDGTDKPNDNEVPQIRLATRCQRRNFVYSKEAVRFRSGGPLFASIDSVFFDEYSSLLYVLLTPEVSYHYVDASHYVAIVRYAKGVLAGPEYVVSENDFASVSGHLRVTAATLVDTTLYLALEGCEVVKLRYIGNDAAPKLEVESFPVRVADARFTSDRRIVKLLYNRQQSILYILYSTSGLIYAEMSASLGATIYHEAPMVQSRTRFAGLYGDENMVVISGTALEGEIIYAFTWIGKTLLPQWRFVCDFCKGAIDSVWLDAVSKQEFQQQSSFRIYTQCGGRVFVLTVQKHAELHVNYDNLPAGKTNVHLLVTSSANWNVRTVDVTLENELEDTYLALWCILGGTCVLGAVIAGAFCWVRYRARGHAGELATGFLFDDTAASKMERSKTKYVASPGGRGSGKRKWKRQASH